MQLRLNEHTIGGGGCVILYLEDGAGSGRVELRSHKLAHRLDEVTESKVLARGPNTSTFALAIKDER